MKICDMKGKREREEKKAFQNWQNWFLQIKKDTSSCCMNFLIRNGNNL